MLTHLLCVWRDVTSSLRLAFRREKMRRVKIKNKMVRTERMDERRMREKDDDGKEIRLKGWKRGEKREDRRRWCFHWKGRKEENDEEKMSLVLMDGSFPLFFFSTHFSSFLWIHLLFSILPSSSRDSSTHHEWGLSLCTEWINNTEPTLVISGQVFLLLPLKSLFFPCIFSLKPRSLLLRYHELEESRGHPSLTKI